MRLLVFGYGYSASAAADRLRSRCAWIGGTTRDPAKAEAMRAAGVVPFLFGGPSVDPALAAAAGRATHVLVSVAPDFDPAAMAARTVDPVLRGVGDLLAASARAGVLRAVVYLSTIGVYGDADGAWVDESVMAKPDNDRTLARRIAEDAWVDFGRASGVAVSVLRLSGIYGPGRNAFVNLREGTARRLVKPGQVFNRIHVDDIAQAVERCFDRQANGVFNVTDDEPAPPQDVIAFAASLMGIEPPPEQDFATATLSPMARSFYGSNKRVSNAVGKSVLGMAYGYPNYRAALGRMWAEDTWR